jgi:GAF domain-containing protein
LTSKKTTRAAQIKAAGQRLQAIWRAARNRDATLREAVTVLHEEIDHYDWVGIYLLEGDELILHNFLGRPTPHARIPVGEGICGAAITADDTIIVDDVHSDSRYLACSMETASEIVVPIRVGGRPVGEIDIDSDHKGAFADDDRRFLEQVAEKLAGFLTD